MADVVVEDLSHSFGGFRALRGISFTIRDGEFFTLVGPSGCGKSTTLMALAGLLRPTGGRIAVGGRVMLDAAAGTFVRPEARNIGLMFQSYALWPHMTVRRNLMFPLSIRKVPRAEANRRIDEVLALVEMLPQAERFPGELSGGQQQRVALARTLVYEPSILLLDEPLSNLDAKLRERARTWLRALQRRTGLTTVYVTHDQSEALSLSDRMAVLNNGEIAQIGDPRQIYHQPADRFVADFVGKINLIAVEAGREGGQAVLRLGDGQALALPDAPAGLCGPARIGIRPERLRLLAADEPAGDGPVIRGRIVSASFEGARYLYVIAVGGDEIQVESVDPLEPGEVRLALSPSAIVWL